MDNSEAQSWSVVPFSYDADLVEHKIDIDSLQTTISPPDFVLESHLKYSRRSYHGRCFIAFLICLRIAFTWIVFFVTLALYGLLILPGIIQVAWHYYFDKRVHRSIPYGKDSRNRFDLYLPSNLDSPKPVVVFLNGGAWVLGYRAWGSLFALELLEHDVIIACIDYRNFPQGTIADMVEDVSQGISFIFRNISEYGGDQNRVYLVGQSAGAHIGACTLMEQLEKQIRGPYGNWRPSLFRGYIGISGGYNLSKLSNHFHRGGFYRSLLVSIMGGEESLVHYSPELQLQNLNIKDKTSSLIPHIYLFHGTEDHSIPCSASTSFADALSSAGFQATVRLYEGKTHTDLFLQDPLRGGQHDLLKDVLAVIGTGFHDSSRLRRRLVPEVLLRLAHAVSPF